ncbi:MAG: hypothetical protein ACLUHA_06690 [Bacteroides stercoris]
MKLYETGTSEEILTEPANAYVERFVENVRPLQNNHRQFHYGRQAACGETEERRS